MSARIVLALLMGLMVVFTAYAHRLDEYLQATTIAIGPDHLTLQLRLIPGVDVAAKVLASIDTNGDRILTDAEKRSYTAWVRHDLLLTLNGQPVTLHLVASLFPPLKEISQGMGGIGLTFEGSLPIDIRESSPAVNDRLLSKLFTARKSSYSYPWPNAELQSIGLSTAFCRREGISTSPIHRFIVQSACSAAMGRYRTGD